MSVPQSGDDRKGLCKGDRCVGVLRRSFCRDARQSIGEALTSNGWERGIPTKRFIRSRASESGRAFPRARARACVGLPSYFSPVHVAPPRTATLPLRRARVLRVASPVHKHRRKKIRRGKDPLFTGAGISLALGDCEVWSRRHIVHDRPDGTRGGAVFATTSPRWTSNVKCCGLGISRRHVIVHARKKREVARESRTRSRTPAAFSAVAVRRSRSELIRREWS